MNKKILALSVLTTISSITFAADKKGDRKPASKEQVSCTATMAIQLVSGQDVARYEPKNGTINSIGDCVSLSRSDKLEDFIYISLFDGRMVPGSRIRDVEMETTKIKSVLKDSLFVFRSEGFSYHIFNGQVIGVTKSD